jgi:uncharacterized alpha-E superfamily protein
VGDFGWVQLLRMCCGLEPFLRTKTADFRREQVADFLVLDPHFPRSLRYCANRIEDHISAVAPFARGASRDACTRLAGRLMSRLDYATLDEVMGRHGTLFIAQVSDECSGINDAVHAAFVSYPLEERLPGTVGVS